MFFFKTPFEALSLWSLPSRGMIWANWNVYYTGMLVYHINLYACGFQKDFWNLPIQNSNCHPNLDACGSTLIFIILFNIRKLSCIANFSFFGSAVLTEKFQAPCPIFHYVLISSCPLKGAWVFIFNIVLNPFYKRMLCAKLGWNWHDSSLGGYENFA